MHQSCHELPACVILSDMKTVRAHLQLSSHLSGRTRERCPSLVFSDSGDVVAAIRTDVDKPELPWHDGEVDEFVINDDALSRSIDEHAWLAEFSRVLARGGALRFTLPAEGPLAWLDAMNLYRYIADISGRGQAPDAALPTGWNRHYTRNHIRAMLKDSGFAPPRISAQNQATKEVGMMLAFISRNWVLGKRDTERRLFPRFGVRSPRGPSMLPATTWSVSARKI
jgi:hypothetical protein